MRQILVSLCFPGKSDPHTHKLHQRLKEGQGNVALRHLAAKDALLDLSAGVEQELTGAAEQLAHAAGLLARYRNAVGGGLRTATLWLRRCHGFCSPDKHIAA